ncbi:hypothetical protein B9T25_14020 [Acinetobacter sp. ANC 4470]|nr:hypothetical protein B9T25_14020 [Acinetobacter sp. ANC 4470]
MLFIKNKKCFSTGKLPPNSNKFKFINLNLIIRAERHGDNSQWFKFKFRIKKIDVIGTGLWIIL